MDTISLLGSGWLGLPLAQHFIQKGHDVKTSTTSEVRMDKLKSIGAIPFIVNIDALDRDITPFLQTDILIVNIPSKNRAGFRTLVNRIAESEIRKVLYVSSTSVYENVGRILTEADTEYFATSPLLEIEDLFQSCAEFKTTVVRFGGLIGPGRHPGNFFRSGKVVQNPDSPVNLIHLDDCIGIVEKIVRQNVWGETLNCCADTHPTKRKFYTQAAIQAGCKQPEFEEADARPGKVISNEKVKQFLDYEFKHPDLMKIVFNKDSR